jgi:hypothetical protein
LTSEKNRLEEEIESWSGFSKALRKEDREPYEAMIKDVREQFSEAIEYSRKDFTVDPFFMAIIMVQQKMIEKLAAEVEARSSFVKG